MYQLWKANKLELERYPNLYSKTLPFFVECAKQENVEQAKMAFERFCPKEFKIIKVSWVRNRMEPHCIWRVEYNLDGLALLPGEGDELRKNFNILEKYHPTNAVVINVQRSSKAIIDYGVACECNMPNFEIAVQSSVQRSLGTLPENMVNIKIAVEEESM